MHAAAITIVRVVPVLCLMTLSGWAVGRLQADNAGESPEERPLTAALDAQSRRPAVSYTAKRRLEGELVDKGERGWMEVMTSFHPERGLTHEVIAEGGSTRIRSKALASVLKKEIEASRADDNQRAAFSSENYRFRLIDTPWDGARLELLPLREDVRLLKGTALVDPDSGGLLKVEGRLSANPSFWIRDVHVARTYARVGNNTLPVDLVSTARVRMFGAARLHITNEYLSVDGQAVRDTGVLMLAVASPAN